MNSFVIGKYVKQVNGYNAFIPEAFPPAGDIKLPRNVASAHTEAIHLLGKLDGVTDRLPDKDLFLI